MFVFHQSLKFKASKTELPHWLLQPSQAQSPSRILYSIPCSSVTTPLPFPFHPNTSLRTLFTSLISIPYFHSSDCPDSWLFCLCFRIFQSIHHSTAKVICLKHKVHLYLSLTVDICTQLKAPNPKACVQRFHSLPGSCFSSFPSSIPYTYSIFQPYRVHWPLPENALSSLDYRLMLNVVFV